MKKTIFAMAAIALLFTASCKKSDSSAPSGTFTIGANSYGTNDIEVDGSSVDAFTADTPPYKQLTFHFPGSTVPAAGTYKVVASSFPNPGEVGITALDYTTAFSFVAYHTTGNDNVSAAVTVSGSGMISISLPKVWASTSSNDSLQLSASLTQTN